MELATYKGFLPKGIIATSISTEPSPLSQEKSKNSRLNFLHPSDMAMIRLGVFASGFVALLFVILCTTYPAYAQDAPSGGSGDCSPEATRLHLPDPPYDNYIYFDCHSSSHVVVTSPISSSNLDVVKPRLLIAWPSGNSGIMTLFEPANGQKGSLEVSLQKSPVTGNTVDGIFETDHPENPNPRVGVTGWIDFNSSAVLTIPIIGSIRAIRDYTEGGRLNPTFQNAIVIQSNPNGGATVWRRWLDDTTTAWITFSPPNGTQLATSTLSDGRVVLDFPPGTYQFDASFNYPQLEQLSPSEVLNPASAGLIGQNPDQTTSLSFLSYKDKLLAGTWRFLTYFGRDSMISMLLMQSILSEGEGGAIEAVISAVLERISKSDGTVCHEEVIGDYASLLNQESGQKSAAPSCDYKMIDTDYFLPIALKSYFVDTQTGSDRKDDFLATQASFLQQNSGSTYSELAQLNAKKIMDAAAPFAANGGQVKENLIHLKNGESVGEWRDSNSGLGGGRIPYDVNTALVPAGLRAIGALSRAGFFPDNSDWGTIADQYAKVWEDNTLRFFEVTISQSEARSLVSSYVQQIDFTGPENTDSINSDLTFYGLALDGSNNEPVVRVMNTDDCFRHFFLNTTDQGQLSGYLNQTAEHILQPFPIVLSMDVGLVVANPAYGGQDWYGSTFKNTDYHGTVVWSWQLSMMAAGLSRQLGRCSGDDAPGMFTFSSSPPFPSTDLPAPHPSSPRQRGS